MTDNGISVAWEGLNKLFEAFDGMKERADEASREIAAKSAAVVEAAAKANFQGSHKKGQPHVGGDRPNVVTGSLRRSIRHDPVVRLGLAEHGTTVGPHMIYGRRVELGYKGSNGHPYFTPAVRDTRAQLQALAVETWRRALRP